ncbi:helix-turn-helix domain-containing protein [Salinirubellus salinus]|uniref:Helix-turn-helix domain-containing protein n=1 Tax=Salinirubellus salinus TaxID=1364945 RepID=A0A9E7R5I0_9EURY|nr:helix-turn-helix domain-containing protein [Salinirubellus salinus]UWM55942.1 helix-turn-helix domain-containing protein [Salinirubellus salinus]
MIAQYLERLFTWESLENTERGVEFELKNRLTDATFNGITAARLDGESIDLSAVSLELPEGTHRPVEEITRTDPLVFDLADTAQVVLDVDRLRLGTHELEVGMDVDGFGAVSFDVTDDVTEADLLDVDPADYTVAALRDLVAGVTEPVELERLLERERDGKDRETGTAAIESRLDAVEPTAPAALAGTDEGDHGRERDALLGGTLADLVTGVLESPVRATVYTALQTCGEASAADVAERTLLTESAVEGTLEDLVLDGVVERGDAGYRAKPPLSVLRSRSRGALGVFGLGLGN